MHKRTSTTEYTADANTCRTQHTHTHNHTHTHANVTEGQLPTHREISSSWPSTYRWPIRPPIRGGQLVCNPGCVACTASQLLSQCGFDAIQINFWVPLTPLVPANTLWVESAPRKADYHPLLLRPHDVLGSSAIGSSTINSVRFCRCPLPCLHSRPQTSTPRYPHPPVFS